ncbi:hypothetical protein ACOSQ2_015243 [Xanthoceras sorbifolium]
MFTARVYSVEEAYQLALQLEKQAQANHYKRYKYTDLGFPRPASTFKQKVIEETVKSATTGDLRGNTKLTREGLQCYKCKGFGHFAIVCPKRDKRVAYVCENELIFDEDAEASGSQSIPETSEPEEEEEVLQGVNLPICVKNRRTNIFHIRVAHGNKALNVIIDNGSGTNVISQAVAERLELPQQNSPHSLPICGSHKFMKKRCSIRDGNQVLIRLRPESFPLGSFIKLHACRVGPFPILKKLGSNAYLVDLPRDYNFNPIFNIEDLTPISEFIWLQALEIQCINPKLFRIYTRTCRSQVLMGEAQIMGSKFPIFDHHFPLLVGVLCCGTFETYLQWYL